MDLHGVLPPIPTPFQNDTVDVQALGANAERWMRTRLAGLVVLGSTGEAPLVDDREADLVVATVRDHVPSDRCLVAGVGRESTRATIAAGERAAAMGADAVLVRPPAYFKPQLSPDALVRHFTSVADAVPIPSLLYHVPAFTGVALPVEVVATLAAHPNIIGIKDSSGDVGRVAALVDATPRSFAVLVGSATTFYASLLVGADGGVLALACVLPEQCISLFEKVRTHQLAEARVLQRELIPVAELVTRVHGVAGVKAALSIIGYVGGDPRPPLTPVGEQGMVDLREALAAFSVTVD